MNKFFFTGRLTADPEISQKASGNAVCHFRMAMSRNVKAQHGKQTADFARLTAFGKRAELIANYFKKGDFIIVEGHFQSGDYVDAKSGEKVYTNDFIADKIEFGPRTNNGNQSEIVDVAEEEDDLSYTVPVEENGFSQTDW